MSIEREKVTQLLRQIVHPVAGKDIVTLNLVENIVIDGYSVSVILKSGKKRDPFSRSLKRVCESSLRSSLGNEFKVNVEIATLQEEIEPEWQPLSEVENIIAVASGKGGVGKSTVAVNLAVTLAGMGYSTGLIDADIYGPSVPKMMGATEDRPVVTEVDGKNLIVPVEKYGVRFLSIGFFVPEESALVWRGPMATSALKQLINDTVWGKLDYLILDLPPGTSDIHLTLVQEVAVTGAVIVSTPQEVALADVKKGVSMFKSENIEVPVLGIVENMAWFTPAELPESRYYIFGKGGCQKLADQLQIPLLAQIPLIQSVAEGGDSGRPAIFDYKTVADSFSALTARVIEAVENRNKTIKPTKKVKVNSR